MKPEARPALSSRSRAILIIGSFGALLMGIAAIMAVLSTRRGTREFGPAQTTAESPIQLVPTSETPRPAISADLCDPSLSPGLRPSITPGQPSTKTVDFATAILDPNPPGPAPQGMVWIPPGRFAMGSDEPMFPDARPIHVVQLDGFWMDRTPVTNDQFAGFVAATGYVTVAEKKPEPRDFPGVPADDLFAGSVVFTPPTGPVPLDDYRGWWSFVKGANWRHPEGPTSDLEGRGEHPVVHVCWEDAVVYTRWAAKRLPTEAEWEFAARGGLTQKPFTWGDDPHPGGRHLANTFQGRFPERNTHDDGWERTSPVGSYPANGFGLLDMSGNVWQWCADYYRPDAYTSRFQTNPRGPRDSFDPQEPGVAKRVQRGGSFLCSDDFCARYRPGGRGKGAPDTGSSHVGFRCVRTPSPANQPSGR